VKALRFQIEEPCCFTFLIVFRRSFILLLFSREKFANLLGQLPNSYQGDEVAWILVIGWVVNEQDNLSIGILLEGRREQGVANDPLLFLVRRNQKGDRWRLSIVEASQFLFGCWSMRSQPPEVPDPRKEVECVAADKKAHKRDIGDAFDGGAQRVIRQSGPENREHLPQESDSSQECAKKGGLRQLQFKGDSLKACALHANPRPEVGPSSQPRALQEGRAAG
jgi:hypothetical protein